MTACFSALQRRLPLAAAFAAGALVSAGVGVGVANAQQPNMQNALSQLQAAKASLLAASPNKGGHRDRAIDLVNRAIAQVQAGIAYASR